MGEIQEESVRVHKNQNLVTYVPTQVHPKSTKIMFLFIKGTYTHAQLLSALVPSWGTKQIWRTEPKESSKRLNSMPCIQQRAAIFEVDPAPPLQVQLTCCSQN